VTASVANIIPGFKSPVFDAQNVFRKILKSMAEPGLISRLDGHQAHPIGLFPATYAIALTLYSIRTRKFI